MIKLILDFVSLFGTSIRLNENLVVEKEKRYFALNEDLMKLMSKDFYYAGSYLGKLKNGKFFPSFELLRMIAKKDANKVVVDKNTEWLFICGRDVFKQGVMKLTKSAKRGDHVLVLNRYNECLGFGRLTCDMNKAREGVVIENILDVGDFLRREKQA